MSVIKVGALQDLSGNTDLDLTNNIVNTGTLNVSTISGVSLSVPSGTIIYFASSSAPTGFLKANGAAISRTVYSELFSYIGTTFGAGDGSTTFNIPDLRGEFIRGWDDARGIDSGRSFGTAQADDFKSHSHTVNDPGHSHTLQDSIFNGGTRIFTSALRSVPSSTLSTDAATTGITINSTGGTETRPRNVALLACIKF